MVLKSHAIVDPGAVVIFPGYAAVASSAMFASKRFPNHARCAEVLFVEVVMFQELLDGGLLLAT